MASRRRSPVEPGHLVDEITHLSFDSFEYGRDPEHAEVELFYLPTKEHLDRVNGKDWY